MTIEHLKGVASGGGSNYLNTAASCLGCNQKRSHQHQIGHKTIPRIKTVVKSRVFTLAYTTPSDPMTLCLYNSAANQDIAMLDLYKREKEPINLIHRSLQSD